MWSLLRASRPSRGGHVWEDCCHGAFQAQGKCSGLVGLQQTRGELLVVVEFMLFYIIASLRMGAIRPRRETFLFFFFFFEWQISVYILI